MNDVFIPLSGLWSANLLTFFSLSLPHLFFVRHHSWSLNGMSLRNAWTVNAAFEVIKNETTKSESRTHICDARWWSNIFIKVTIIFSSLHGFVGSRNYTSFTFIKAIWLSNFTGGNCRGSEEIIDFNPEIILEDTLKFESIPCLWEDDPYARVIRENYVLRQLP